MNYSIQELEDFLIIGQEIELTNFQKRNIQISAQFWRKFNTNLKESYLPQSNNWVKYTFMERRQRKLFYYCAIPKKTVVPEGFILKEIKPHRYLVVEHIGSMDKIYETYRKVY
jgi:predicted transcriptional regulator YdeE